MFRIVAFVRPHKLEETKTSIAACQVSGLSVSECRGRGAHPERATHFAGQSVMIELPIRSRVEVVVSDEKLDEVIAAIEKAAHTGADGDGFIYVETVIDAVKVRTGERGPGVI